MIAIKKALIFLALSSIAPLGWGAINSAYTYPGGANSNVQYNHKSTFGGDASFTYSTTTHLVTISSANVVYQFKVPIVSVLVNADCDSGSEAGKIVIVSGDPTGQRLYACEGSSGWVLQGDGYGTGGEASLGVFNGGVEISSPTARIDFSTYTFVLSESPTGTSNIELDPSSVTMRGNTFNTSGSIPLIDSYGYIEEYLLDPSSVTLLGSAPDTDSISEGSTNLYFTVARTTGSIVATAPITYSNGNIGIDGSFLSTTTADSTYLSNSSATATYLQLSSASDTYFPIISSTTLLTTSSASATYFQINSSMTLSNVFLTNSSATATYLQLSSATDTYLTKSSASASYVQDEVDPHSILNRNTLQSGATFFVSSGTVAGRLYAGYFEGNGSSLTAVTTIFPEDIDRNGFLNQTETSISFSSTTGVFTLADEGSGWSYYRTGKKYTISGDKTVTIDAPTTPPTTGMYYIYIDATDGTLTQSRTTPWTLTDTKIPVATIYWATANTPNYMMAEERHSCLIDRRMHWFNHFIEGTKIASLGLLDGPQVGSDVDANKVFGISASIIADEDLRENLGALTKPNGITTDYTVIYRVSASSWTWTKSKMPFRASATYPYYDASGTPTVADANKYVNTYFAMCNVQGYQRYFMIQGQRQFTTLALAQAETPATFSINNFPVAEFVVTHQFTWQTSAANSSTGKCTLAATPRTISVSASALVSGVTSLEHNATSGLQGGSSGEYFHATAIENNNLSSLTTSYIKNTSTLQSGTTFFVSSGTVAGNFYVEMNSGGKITRETFTGEYTDAFYDSKVAGLRSYIPLDDGGDYTSGTKAFEVSASTSPNYISSDPKLSIYVDTVETGKSIALTHGYAGISVSDFTGIRISSSTFNYIDLNDDVLVKTDAPVIFSGNSTSGGILLSDNDGVDPFDGVILKSSNTVTGNVTLILPPTVGTAGQSVVGDGTGNLYFATVSGTSIYSATSTASFPYGFSSSTGIFTSSITSPGANISTITAVSRIVWADGTIQVSSPVAGGSTGGGNYVSTQTIYIPAWSMLSLETVFAPLVTISTNSWFTNVARFDDTTRQFKNFTFAIAPNALATSTVTFTVDATYATSASSKKAEFDLDYYCPAADSSWMSASVSSTTSGGFALNANSGNMNNGIWTSAFSALGWVAGRSCKARISRDTATTDDVTGDVYLHGLKIEIPVDVR